MCKTYQQSGSPISSCAYGAACRENHAVVALHAAEGCMNGNNSIKKLWAAEGGA